MLRLSRSTPAVILLSLAASLPACAPKRIDLPTGTGTPYAEAAAAYGEAVKECRGVRTMQVTLGLLVLLGDRFVLFFFARVGLLELFGDFGYDPEHFGEPLEDVRNIPLEQTGTPFSERTISACPTPAGTRASAWTSMRE